MQRIVQQTAFAAQASQRRRRFSGGKQPHALASYINVTLSRDTFQSLSNARFLPSDFCFIYRSRGQRDRAFAGLQAAALEAEREGY